MGTTCEDTLNNIGREQRWTGRGEARTARGYSMPDQIIELHLLYFHCRLTFYERVKLPMNVNGLVRPTLNRAAMNKAAEFVFHPILRRTFMGPQVKAVHTLKHLWKYTGTSVHIKVTSTNL